MPTLKEFLRSEVKPALGCTEPGAVALAVARACAELPDRGNVAAVRVTVSANIYKNGMAVGIPGAGGARGNAIAAALGAICGDASRGLEVLAGTKPEDVKKAEAWVEEKRATIYCDQDRGGVYVLASVFTPEHKAMCLIEGSHSNIVKVTADGETTFEKERPSGASSGFADDGFPTLFADVLKMADEMDGEDEDFIWEGVEMNDRIAAEGIKPAGGGSLQSSNFGLILRNDEKVGDFVPVALEIRTTASAAAEARMSGVQLPVMSSAGSGNHGITAIIPIAVLGRRAGKSRSEIAKAIAVSHLATSFVKRNLGRLSPVCGCSVAAGAGAAAGMTYLMGGTYDQICSAMSLLLSNIAGMLCDGAKESCALKVGSASSEAYCAMEWALEGQHLTVPQGVFGASIEETVANVGRVSREGMKTVDRVMIDILDERHRPNAEAF
ncbi:L-serine ammonia-lyase, iron-sulfur-dependent, subunit alpha [uncultured Cloacibacillus sp.]|uniref:L-cysteine desulfidase family protein n=1 Tax=uncultured Cloacibacillus sp. TaxID=889794 RepID=UPI0025E68516|nr:L-serine ammonia-lyase, iron-sulfur-dependent, subunit alpha [uncultured Cloacibacillus sp.]